MMPKIAVSEAALSALATSIIIRGTIGRRAMWACYGLLEKYIEGTIEGRQLRSSRVQIFH